MKTNRRTALKTLAAAPVAAGFAWTAAEAQQAHTHAQAARRTAQRTGAAFEPQFFTPQEYATVRVLVDLIIPKDERSGSATDAGVPEFIDFLMTDSPARQIAVRGGLAWLDRECETRYDKRFLACTDAERAALLDDIAWPQKAKPQLSHGVAFFNGFRDLTASGFWSSKMGTDDLVYMGNVVVAEWNGCPANVLQKLGLDPVD